MPSLTTLKQPIVRRLIREDVALVVRITNRGVEIRGYRCRRRRFMTWEQIASLSGDDAPILFAGETATGRRVLEALAPPVAGKAKAITEETEGSDGTTNDR